MVWLAVTCLHFLGCSHLGLTLTCLLSSPLVQGDPRSAGAWVLGLSYLLPAYISGRQGLCIWKFCFFFFFAEGFETVAGKAGGMSLYGES